MIDVEKANYPVAWMCRLLLAREEPRVQLHFTPTGCSWINLQGVNLVTVAVTVVVLIDAGEHDRRQSLGSRAPAAPIDKVEQAAHTSARVIVPNAERANSNDSSNAAWVRLRPCTSLCRAAARAVARSCYGLAARCAACRHPDEAVSLP